MKTVFFDVDTQIDFLYPAGALYVPGAETIIPRIAELNRCAAEHGIPLISTMDAHMEDDPEFKLWPPHCVAGTDGQKKPARTLIGPQQIFIEKQTLDCFTSPKLPEVLRRLAAERYVVYGVVAEICVKFAAVGLLRTGARVEIVADAVRSLNQEACDRFFAEFQAAGGVLTSLAEQLVH